MTPEQSAERARIKSIYIDAIRDWVSKGPRSEHVFDATAARARLRRPQAGAAQAHVHFTLAQHLKLVGRKDEAAMHFSEANRLHPHSWNLFRQSATKLANGSAAGEDFWARVEALGDEPYHLPIDMKGISR